MYIVQRQFAHSFSHFVIMRWASRKSHSILDIEALKKSKVELEKIALTISKINYSILSDTFSLKYSKLFSHSTPLKGVEVKLGLVEWAGIKSVHQMICNKISKHFC